MNENQKTKTQEVPAMNQIGVPEGSNEKVASAQEPTSALRSIESEEKGDTTQQELAQFGIDESNPLSGVSMDIDINEERLGSELAPQKKDCSEVRDEIDNLLRSIGISDESSKGEEEQDELGIIQKELTDPTFPTSHQVHKKSTESEITTTKGLIKVLEDETDDLFDEPLKSEINVEGILTKPLSIVLPKLNESVIKQYDSGAGITSNSVRKRAKDEGSEEAEVFDRKYQKPVPRGLHNKENVLNTATSRKRTKSRTSEDDIEDLKETKKYRREEPVVPFSMQTRKRQLKFLPDGSLVTPKKGYVSTGAVIRDESSESDESIASESSDRRRRHYRRDDTDSEFELDNINRSVKAGRPRKKVYDYESYFKDRMKAKSMSFDSADESPEKVRKIPTKEIGKQKIGSIHPAQLLSQILNYSLVSSQLDAIEFFPKALKNQVFNRGPKIKSSWGSADTETYPKSEPQKLEPVPKEATKYRPILPKTTVSKTEKSVIRLLSQGKGKIGFAKVNKYVKKTERKTHIIRSKLKGNGKIIRKDILRNSPVKTVVSFPSDALKPNNTLSLNKVNPETLLNEAKQLSDLFPDENKKSGKTNRVVRTKYGPKKAHIQKLEDEQGEFTYNPPASEDVSSTPDEKNVESPQPKSIFSLMEEISVQMPSWNLHMMPDTNTFCIAQVSRGRMGIPILKKSIELDENFSAKVYVHQLHCKRFDGTYADVNSIINLIKEIDELSA